LEEEGTLRYTLAVSTVIAVLDASHGEAQRGASKERNTDDDDDEPEGPGRIWAGKPG
jgi:hypothetical protein